jgi:hypothetical protein
MKIFDLSKDKPEDILKELTYSSYAHNRDLGCSALGLQAMGFKSELEERYRNEKQFTPIQFNLGSPEERKN